MANLVCYPEIREVAEHYARSPRYCRERLVAIDEYEHRPDLNGATIILGRTGHYHHYDLKHIRLLRERGAIPAGEQTTLVVYDWHADLDHDPAGTELGNGTWAYLGLMERVYHDVYVVGVDPRGWNELNMVVWDGETLRETSEEMIRVLDRVYLFPLAPAYFCLKLFAECVPFLAGNPSVKEYFVVNEGEFVEVRFRAADEVTYRNRKQSVVVSIDLDVVRRSELRTDCPQGVASVDWLLAQLDRLRATGPLDAVLICGLTESPELHDERTFESVSRVLAKSTEILEGAWNASA
jgi:hypothetical protein